MSYEVIARKWRPQKFSEVIGQHHVSDILKHSIKTGRLAPVYLFTGIRGTGKTTLARIFVRALNCTSLNQDGEPCNSCENCLETIKGLSPDVIEIDGASNNSVEDIRLIKENIAYHPIKSKYKIYIIDEAHMLSKSAFNALLKTLEEPPSYVIFILATTDPQKIPVTVLSRCQRYDLRRLGTKEVVMQLSRITEAEERTFEKEALYAIAREGEGSMRDSQTLLEQIMTLEDGPLTEKSVEIILGQSSKEYIRNLLLAMTRKDSLESLKLLRHMRDSGASSEKIMKDLIFLLHQMIIYLEVKNFDFLDASDEEKKWIEETSAKASRPDWIRLFDFLTERYAKIKSSEFAESILEVSVLSAASFPVMADIEAITAFFTKAASAVDEDSKKKTEKLDIISADTVEKEPEKAVETLSDEIYDTNSVSASYDDDVDYPDTIAEPIYEEESSKITESPKIKEVEHNWKGFLDFVSGNGMLYGFLCNQRFEESENNFILYIDPESVHFEYFKPEIDKYSEQFFGEKNKIVYKHSTSTKETFVELERIEEKRRIDEIDKRIRESSAVKEFLDLGFTIENVHIN